MYIGIVLIASAYGVASIILFTSAFSSVTGGFPYYDLSNEVLVHRILGGYQMKRPTNCSDEM